VSKLAPTKSDRILEAVVRQDLDHLLGYCRLLSKLWSRRNSLRWATPRR